jgi:hypothetical protein
MDKGPVPDMELDTVEVQELGVADNKQLEPLT